METKVYKNPCLTRTAVLLNRILGVKVTPLAVVYRDDGVASLTRACRICGEESTVEIDNAPAVFAMLETRDHPHAETVFPYLTGGQRELFFMSGMCEQCYGDVMYPMHRRTCNA